MDIVNISVKRPVTISMVILCIIFIGTLSLRKIPVDLFPKINRPILSVYTSYEGASPEDIEKLVTLPLEMQLSSISGLTKIESISREGSSNINLIFSWDVDIDMALSDIRQRIDLIKFQLPEDIEAPVIRKFDPNQDPIMIVNISSSSSPDYLRNYIEDVLKPIIDRIVGIAAVKIKGGLEREIRVLVDIDKLTDLGLSFEAIKSKIISENIERPGGRVESGKRELLVRTIGKVENEDDIANILLARIDDRPVYIGDVAEIFSTYKERREFARLNGLFSISLEVYKVSEGNTLNIAQNVKDTLKNYQFPKNVEYAISYDQSNYINKSLDLVKGKAVTGALLAALVLLLFLKNLKSAFIISLSMPISIVCSFAPFYFTGMTLNVFSIAGIALGVGLVVDNSIVILENINRYQRDGASSISASIEGTKEVGGAVLASTLTTLAVFIPIIFVSGIAGKIFKDLSLTVIYVLSFSMLTAITIIPMLSSKVLKEDFTRHIQNNSKKGMLKRTGYFIYRILLLDRISDFTMKHYNIILKKLTESLKFRIISVTLVLIFFIMTLFMIPDTELIPSGRQREFYITFSTPLGIGIDRANEILIRIEKILTGNQEVETVSSSLSDIEGINEGEILFLLKAEKTSKDIVEKLKSEIQEIVPAGYEFSIRPISIFENIISDTSEKTLTGDFVIKVMGTGFESIETSSDSIFQYFSGNQNISELRTSKSQYKPQILIEIDRYRASSLGLSTNMIAQTIKTNLAGDIASDIKQKGEQIDINVMGDRSLYTSIDDIKNIPFYVNIADKTISVPLSHFAKVETVSRPIEIRHEERQRMIGVSGDIKKGYSLGKLLSDLNIEEYNLEALSEKLGLSDDVFISLSGSAQTLLESISQLKAAFLMAIALVYMIMAAQFESLLQPFIIMFAIPLSLIGAFFGLNLFGFSLSIVAFIGLIMMLGIVVNDSILLVNYINILRLRGIERKQAIITAGNHRIKPILMTTFTSLLGMLPMAFGIGSGSEFYASMAMVIIFGLLFATILTLLIIPVIYIIFDDIAEHFSLITLRLKNLFLKI